MVHLVIQHRPGTSHELCALCGQCSCQNEGPQLCTADRPQAVCRDCGRKHAPALMSLLDLAHTARRVGRIGRHTLVPPLTALLDLARAAEDYLHASPAEPSRAI